MDIDDRDFSDIRNDLNLDDETAEDAWNSFRRISANYSLEGEKMDWIACALYASCRKCVTQTVGKGNKIEGNLVSLTRILRTCNLSLVRFFNKMKNWSEMANMHIDMRNKLDQLERNFNVTTVIFKKYKPIFEDVFKCPAQLSCRFFPKNRKQIRKQALNSLDVFTFCWTLFVYIKSKYSQISDDLVNSYHLLLVCLDYCFSSVLSFDNYQDIMNTNFYDKLATELNTDPRTHNNDNRVNIIDSLCAKWKGISIEVKQIKKHWFKPFLKALVEKEEIRKRGNGIIDADVIDFNFKYLKREYENFVLTIGDFDECVFLNESASEELGTSELRPNFADLDDNLLSRQTVVTPASYVDQGSRLMPMTPLSSRQYLASRTPVNKMIQLTPITAATSSISRLHSILIGHNNEPSVDLDNLFSKCKVNPGEKISNMVRTMGEIFLNSYSRESSPQSTIRSTEEIQYIVTDEFPKNRLDFAIKFFYNVLEKILKGELRRNQQRNNSHIDEALARIIDRDIFLRSLFACSLEIVLYSYSPYNRMFPWILNIFNSQSSVKIHPFYFYKVIEPIIRDEDGLSREIVKHLNTIEEKILDCLAWNIDSPIWALLGGKQAPNFTEVTMRLETLNMNLDSPIARAEPASMPVPSIFNGNCSAKRQLVFGGSDTPVKTETGDSMESNSAPVMNPLRNALGGPANSISREVDENMQSSIRGTQQFTQIKSETGELPNKTLKTGQLGLFFRKVYSLASVRLRDLYNRLQINSEEIQRKIWTCFEHCLTTHTILMCDHHLDQLIMCSIFCICKLNKFDDRVIAFSDIIKFYRLQPQAISQVYRNVLLVSRKLSEISAEPDKSESNQSTSGNESNMESNDATGSIIEFYNQVFIVTLTQAYIMKFSSSEKNSPTLSPMPRAKFSSPVTHSPIRRVSNYMFVSPLRTTTPSYPPSPNRSKTCRFQSGNLNSSQDLKAINSIMKSSAAANNNAANDMKATIATAYAKNLMNSGAPNINIPNATRVSKRIFQDEESDSSQNNKSFCLDRRINDIVSDRQFISASSSANVTDDSNDSIQFNRQPPIGLNIANLSSVSPMLGNHETVINTNFANARTSPHLLLLADAGLNSNT